MHKTTFLFESELEEQFLHLEQQRHKPKKIMNNFLRAYGLIEFNHIPLILNIYYADTLPYEENLSQKVKSEQSNEHNKINPDLFTVTHHAGMLYEGRSSLGNIN